MNAPTRASILFAVVVASLLAYYLLLYENCLHSSIHEIVDFSQTLDITHHLFILGLLPIYIAAMIFGAVMFGIYLGRAIQRLFLVLTKG